MDTDAAALAAQAAPYAAAALSAYGGAVLAKIEDTAAEATIGAGRRLLQKIFGTRRADQPLPAPLASLTAHPQDPDALAALRVHLRAALEASPELRDEIRALLPARQVTITAIGDGSIAAQTISGTASTGDNTTIHPPAP